MRFWLGHSLILGTVAFCCGGPLRGQHRWSHRATAPRMLPSLIGLTALIATARQGQAEKKGEARATKKMQHRWLGTKAIRRPSLLRRTPLHSSLVERGQHPHRQQARATAEWMRAVPRDCPRLHMPGAAALPWQVAFLRLSRSRRPPT
mmetsp:Transcript_15900/g.43577  ORF Transcript_15900/g.43577 Transcript_15900/m.43577 type:complete len:148 (+) Transcript_15900:3-446(+)